jgi:transketolase
MASGSEVHLAIEAAKKLEQKGIAPRVVSMPSWELFDRQPEAYRQDVFPPATKPRIAMEAGRSQGWWRYVGEKGDVVGIEHFGASAPYKVLYEKFGLTAERVVEKALKLLGRS